MNVSSREIDTNGYVGTQISGNSFPVGTPVSIFELTRAC